MSRPTHDLARLAESVLILSADRASIEGELVDLTTHSGAEDTAWPVTDPLALEIYHRLYTGAGGPVEPSSAAAPARRDLLARLSEANTGKGTWERGWKILRRETDGKVLVEKDGLELLAAADQLRLARGGARPGAICRMRVGKELRELQQGFYFALGDGEEAEATSNRRLVRFYWHLVADGAVPFIAALTGRLNANGVPFRAKVLSDPSSFRRADAGVLYLDRRDVQSTRRVLLEIYRQVEPFLRSEVPLFTRRLANGLAVADDPGDGQSFGQHRSALAARGLRRAFAAGHAAVGARLRELRAVFREAGLDPNRLHLGPGAREAIRAFPQRPIHAAPPARRRSLATGVDWLAPAARIGDALCRKAYWHEGRCNWMGHAAEERDALGTVTPTFAALPPDLYHGTAGVGLFLAELAARTHDAQHWRTAEGAFAQAFWKVNQRPAALALFEGRLGVAWAASRAASLLGSASLARQARRLTRPLPGDRLDQGSWDLLSGRAGALLALLLLDCQKNITKRLAKALCQAGVMGERPLAGLSHGASGLALALLELAAAIADDRLRAAARAAFAYEDTLFDIERSNWPDLRAAAGAHGGAEVGGKFIIAWCHGAPGVALARLRASELDPALAASHREVARVALATTARGLVQRLRQPGGDTSLCHGLAGLGEVLLVGSQILGDRDLRLQAEEAARALLERHLERGDWPSGTATQGPNPSLMLGEAGIGHWLLRLHDPEGVPSVLLPGYPATGSPALSA